MENENTKHAAMTPNTQSVCGERFNKHVNMVCNLEKGHSHMHHFEPVAEPASTGEPELSKAEARQLAAGLIDYAEGRVQSLDEIEREIGIEECEGGLAIGAKAEQGIVGTQPLSPIKSSLRNEHSSINLVARPPEPSAPQAISGMYISETKPHKVEIFNREPVSDPAPSPTPSVSTEPPMMITPGGDIHEYCR